MPQLTYFTTRRPRARLLASAVAEAASHTPLPLLRLLLRPFVLVSGSNLPTSLVRRADRVIALVAGDGLARRVAREHGRSWA